MDTAGHNPKQSHRITKRCYSQFSAVPATGPAAAEGFKSFHHRYRCPAICAGRSPKGFSGHAPEGAVCPHFPHILSHSAASVPDVATVVAYQIAAGKRYRTPSQNGAAPFGNGGVRLYSTIRHLAPGCDTDRMTELDVASALAMIEARNPADGTLVGEVPNDSAECVAAKARELRLFQPEWEPLGAKGLSASVWTRDAERGERMARQIVGLKPRGGAR